MEAIRKLVVFGEVQAGFRLLEECGLLKWSHEADVLKVPEEFMLREQEAARWRLEQAEKKLEPLFHHLNRIRIAVYQNGMATKGKRRFAGRSAARKKI